MNIEQYWLQCLNHLLLPVCPTRLVSTRIVDDSCSGVEGPLLGQMCEFLSSVAATDADVDEDRENHQVGSPVILAVFAYCFSTNSRKSYVSSFSSSLGSSLGL